MHQHKVLSARPKIEKGKKLFEPSFTLYLVLTVGPSIQSTQNASGEWTWMTRFRAPAELLIYHRNRGLLWKSKCCLKIEAEEEYSGLFKKSRWRRQELKKWTRKSTTRDKRSSDIYRMNPWKRPRTTKIRSNILMYKSVLKDQTDFQLSTQIQDK